MPRTPEYLSPSALALYKKDTTEYYRRYCCSTKPYKMPQTVPMAVGSAFDAFVKSHLHKILCKSGRDAEKYDLQTLFDAQVESQNRQSVWEYGSHLFDMYRDSGALADLMLELSRSIDEPRFEIDLQGTVRLPESGTGIGHEDLEREPKEKKIQGVILMGKPDLRFINQEGAHCIFDFKVNGFMSPTKISPAKGYIQDRVRQTLPTDGSPSSWCRQGCHKDAFMQNYKGMMLNMGVRLEEVNEEWAAQLATYGWLLGEEPGKEMICGIEQVCGNKDNLRIVSHRCRIGGLFQIRILNDYIQLWQKLHDYNDEGYCYFFTDLSRDESLAKQKLLEREVEVMNRTTDSDASWAFANARTQ